MLLLGIQVEVEDDDVWSADIFTKVKYNCYDMTRQVYLCTRGFACSLKDKLVLKGFVILEVVFDGAQKRFLLRALFNLEPHDRQKV